MDCHVFLEAAGCGKDLATLRTLTRVELVVLPTHCMLSTTVVVHVCCNSTMPPCMLTSIKTKFYVNCCAAIGALSHSLMFGNVPLELNSLPHRSHKKTAPLWGHFNLCLAKSSSWPALQAKFYSQISYSSKSK